jgi:hypothetical protein
MTNTGKEYEALVEQVLARLLAQDKVCANIERDVTLQGRSTSHQIDVTFVFSAGPISYRTVVQCKDWKSRVKKEQVLAFQRILEDIPGQPRGIIVARSGFQAGARQVAEHHGIKVYELRKPCDEDWTGLVRACVTEVVVRLPHFDNACLVWDENAIKQEMLARGLTNLEWDCRDDPGPPPLAFSSGERCDLNDVLNQLVRVRGCT